MIVTPLKNSGAERASKECETVLLALNSAIVSLYQVAKWKLGS